MKISIGGDVAVTKENFTLFDTERVQELFHDVTDVFNRSDNVIVNLECALTDSDTPIQKFGPPLKGPIRTAETLKKAGVTHCVLSNNHTFDYGKRGLYDTLNALDNAGIAYTGVGENATDARKDMIISDGKIKVAVLSVCEHEYSYALPDRIGTREYDPYDTSDDIVSAKKNADYVIVLYHGGKEDCRYPSPRLLKLCRSMVKHGADVVLCQHSHCIGCYENFEGGHILYGQGNFHFAGDFSWIEDHEMWETGLIVSLNLTEKCDISFIPVVADDHSIRLAAEPLKTKLLNELAERSEKLKNGDWLTGWQKFCEENKETYIAPIRDGNYDVFGHYLDCEAHTDVWRELFKTYNWTNEK